MSNGQYVVEVLGLQGAGRTVTVYVPGSPGQNATIEIGDVTTGEEGTPAEVENVGSPVNAKLNFKIPKGGITAAAQAALTEIATQAQAANQKAGEAAASATASGTSAGQAEASALSAANSKTAAQDAAEQAIAAKETAVSARTDAQSAATASSTSASNASTSAGQAAGSATAAGTSATNAAGSATAAAGSATAAGTSASNAAGSATAAAGSATAATASATSAATSATQSQAARDDALAVREALPAISQTFHTGTIVKAIIYDTSKDSDGGAWRKRCADKSWFKDSINGTWRGERANELAARYTLPNAPGGDNWTVSGAPTLVTGAGGHFQNGGTAGNFLSVADSPVNSPTGDVELIVKAALTDWTPSASQTLIAKDTGNVVNRAFRLYVATTGRIALVIGDGTTATALTSTAAPTVSDGADLWLKAVGDINDGAGNRAAMFYTSTDGVTWTQLGATVTAAGAFSSLVEASATVQIGGYGATFDPLNGKIYYAEVKSGIGGTTVAKFDAAAGTTSATGDYYHNTTDGKFYSLNAISGQTETFRGNVREFPEVVAIVAEAARVIIYDLTQPSVPMWMVFVRGFSFRGWTPITSLAAINGILFVTGNNGSGSGDLQLTNFVSDTVSQRTGSTGGSATLVPPQISTRNSNGSALMPGFTPIAAHACNDVAVTVMPDAPIDIATGLPIPTIAVATDGGVSVIHNTGSVVNTNSTSSFKRVNINKRFDLIADVGSSGSQVWVARNIGSLGASFSVTNSYALAAIPSGTPVNQGVGQQTPMGDGALAIARANIQLLTLLRENPSNIAKSTVAYITNAYNSGWLVGDIRGAWLADNTAETLTASGELVTNGAFAADLSGWTVNLNGGTGTVVWSSGVASITGDGTNPASLRQSIATIPGKTYRIAVTPGVSTLGLYAGTSSGAQDLLSVLPPPTGEQVYQFTATGTTTHITLFKIAATQTTADNVSVKLAAADRSVKSNGMAVNGSITKAAVASGADLMAFGGFSASNYLEQPYNAGLDFGTGDFCIMGWTKADNSARSIFYRGEPGTSFGTRALSLTTGSSQAALRIAGATTTTTTSVGACPIDGGWHFIVGLRRAGTLETYVNGALVATAASSAVDLTSTSAKSYIGQTIFNSAQVDFASGVALVRAGATAPSADQIRFIYETEKKLFEANAKCLLDGTSTSVTALAYDENADTLQVGTSWGRSAFRDLVRVESGATAVGALTALAGNQGAHITAGASGARYSQPAMQLRDELRRREEACRALGKIPVSFDFDTIGFTGNTTSGNANVTSVSVTTGTPYVGMGVTGTGIQADTTILAINGTTYTLSKTATATGSTVAMGQSTFDLPKGFATMEVRSAGAVKRPGATKDYTVGFDGFKETVTFGVSPGNATWVRIQATRSN